MEERDGFEKIKSDLNAVDELTADAYNKVASRIADAYKAELISDEQLKSLNSLAEEKLTAWGNRKAGV